MSIEEQVASLRQEAREAGQRHAAALAGQDAAQAKVTAVRLALHEEFGVETAEGARELLAALEDDIGKEAARVRGLLAAAEEAR